MPSQQQLDKPKSFTPITQDPHNLSNVNVGKWTTEENLKYAIFMDFHKVTLLSRQKKKNFRVFEQMSAFIGSRNTVQCRSHHQKLQERFKHFKKIISAVKNEIGRKDYKQQYKKWTNSGSKLVFEAAQVREKPEMNKQLTEKETTKEVPVVRPVEIKVEEQFYPQNMYSFMAYSPFANAYGFPMPGIYPFTVPYFA